MNFIQHQNHSLTKCWREQYSTMKEYDLIIMNPPFSNGNSRLWKALDLQERNGGAVICLLNAETLKNPYTKYSKVVANSDYYLFNTNNLNLLESSEE